jgi:twitching motility protein PilU
LILEEKVNDIHQYIYKGKSDGMQTLNQSLYILHEKGIITIDTALYYSDQPNELKLMIEGKHGMSHGMDDGTLVSWI